MNHPRFILPILLLAPVAAVQAVDAQRLGPTCGLALTDGKVDRAFDERDRPTYAIASDAPTHSPPEAERHGKPSVGAPKQGVTSTPDPAAIPRDDKKRGDRRRQTKAISPPAMRAIGAAVGQGFRDWDTFLPKWYAEHPGVWVATDLVHAAWAETSWTRINTFFVSKWPENYYDYGNRLTFDNDAVYLDGLRCTSAADYAQAARDLALHGLQPADEKQPWLPLGIYALTDDADASVKVVVQLAVNRAGLVRGNHYRVIDRKVLLVQGSIYQDTQRIAWIIGGNQDIVFDTGLYNLTQRETPVLVHSGLDDTEQLLLIRMKRP